MLAPGNSGVLGAVARTFASVDTEGALPRASLPRPPARRAIFGCLRPFAQVCWARDSLDEKPREWLAPAEWLEEPTEMTLFDILACPVCKGELQRRGEHLACVACSRTYPIREGVPILLPDPERAPLQNESELVLRSGYDPWIHRMVLQSLTDAQVVVEIGCGNMTLDDPCIIRMDVAWTPHVDLVADVHALPFKPATVDFVFGLAVLEHLRNPFTAAASIYEALKPGGYVYGEANFVFAYHGFPRHFFNISVHGLEEIFVSFRALRVGIAPYQMPSFAIESLLGTYLTHFPARRPAEQRFADLLRLVLQHPLRKYDGEIDRADAFRTAAGTYFYGMKQVFPEDTVLPRPVMELYERSDELRERYPEPYDLSAPSNLMTWAMGEGRNLHPSIAEYFYALEPFRKYRDAGHAVDRSAIRSLPPIPDPDAARVIGEPAFEQMEAAAARALSELAGRAAAPLARRTVRPASFKGIGAPLARLRDPLAGARRRVARLTGAARRHAPPLPDPPLIFSVCGTEDRDWFLQSGQQAADEIRGALERSGVRMERLRRILDFGCGAGRVLRHWRTLRGPALYGTDYNPDLIGWCEAHLPFARFAVNRLEGPLPYGSRRFDLVYAFSVFTHLTEEQQLRWMDELNRVLRPGAYLYLTTHGESYLPHVPVELRQQFRRGQVVVTGTDQAGSNICAAFHPEPYVLGVLANGLRCLEFAPGRFPQDAYLFQKAG
jgi:SAM-dependent methyltransferase/uncharacterized protein YbaR (Trm112 family)